MPQGLRSRGRSAATVVTSCPHAAPPRVSSAMAMADISCSRRDAEKSISLLTSCPDHVARDPWLFGGNQPFLANCLSFCELSARAPPPPPHQHASDSEYDGDH